MFPQFTLNLKDKQASTTSGQEINQISHILIYRTIPCNKSNGRNRPPFPPEQSN
uniref:Uncharacterized protein n=1 Tax=Arundo donax TaxID=35708 RepID=A0A0A9GXS5_ARUDO